MTDRFRDRLSEFRDGELAPADAELTRKHLESCPECSATLADLERVVARAARMPDRHLETDLWTGIESRITERVPHEARRPVFGRRIALSIPQLAAAAITLASVSAAGAWIVARPGETPAGAAPERMTAPDAALLASDAGVDDHASRIGAAIADLERALFDPARSLPPATTIAIRRSLVKIDRAIADARAALETRPGDPYLREHRDETMRRKADFLRRAVRLSQS